MKVFVTGVAGQLGHDVMNELSKRGYEGIGTSVLHSRIFWSAGRKCRYNNALCFFRHHR